MVCIFYGHQEIKISAALSIMVIFFLIKRQGQFRTAMLNNKSHAIKFKLCAIFLS